ncbi:hypothetical protein BDB00DRAFT_787407 [Zychaea mexicana]|uniref:uncharacterized protein n=1 Tax=Zychaea mexicana TaxID=64656 RepID=UPI0022FEC7D7|nr:uncharacterized protein BDB00DRAFT_787407 [Zychaea mexicana]KAI9494198.1 hypothetical protein BDB00DRAFT_787407 [Zychaea mexicana]
MWNSRIELPTFNFLLFILDTDKTLHMKRVAKVKYHVEAVKTATAAAEPANEAIRSVLLVSSSATTKEVPDDDLESAKSLSSIDENPKKLYKDRFEVFPLDLDREIKDRADRWIASNNVDITKLLEAYQKRSISETKTNKTISNIRALSLCCIFFFGLKESVVTVKEDELLRNQCKPDLPSVLPTWASDIEQAAAIESRDFVASVFIDVLNSFVGVPSACDNNIVEDTLVHTYLHALLHALFVKDAPFGHKRANAVLESSRDSLNQLFPDFTAYKRASSRTYDLFVVEVKRPTSSKSDFIKMGIMLRGMINKLVELSVPNPTFCTIGFKCTTYRLDLKAKHVYRMVELQEFLLPQESNQVGCLPTCIQALGQVKEILAQTAKNINDCDQLLKNGKVLKNRTPIDWIVKTQASSMKEKKNTKSKGKGPLQLLLYQFHLFHSSLSNEPFT